MRRPTSAGVASRGPHNASSKLDELEQLVARGEWEAALPLALDLDLAPDYVSHLAQQLLVALLPALDVPLLDDLSPRIRDKAWLAATCVRIATSTSEVQLATKALKVGIEATTEWVDRHPTLSDAVASDELDTVEALVRGDEQVEQVAKIRRTLLELRVKVETWNSIWRKQKGPAASGEPASESEGAGDVNKAEDGEDHGWDDLDLPQEDQESGQESRSEASTVDTLVDPSHPRLSTFLLEPLVDVSLSLAAYGAVEELDSICRRHPMELWPSRTQLLKTLPEWLEPEDYLWLLPAVDSKGVEASWSDSSSGRTNADWSSQLLPAACNPPRSTEQAAERRTSDELTSFYVSHIERIASLGFVHTALSLVQHGASRGIIGLDELGEELSLLSKLVYDRPRQSGPSSEAIQQDLTLEYWRSLQPDQVVRAYLAHSDPTNLATTIRRLVLPYLSVLESRLERAGTPDPTLSNRLVYDYILSLSSDSMGLDLLHAIFESSKPTLPTGARLVKDDKDLAKLAIAGLYGSPATDELAIVSMGKIFECLPALSDSSSSSDRADSNGVDLFSLATAPASAAVVDSPRAVFDALAAASPRDLSHALDVLDLHLSQLETFSRYSSPTRLAWFLTAHRSESDQRAWATRLARTAATGGGGHRGNAREFESEDEWMGLGEALRAMTDSQGEDKSGSVVAETPVSKRGMGRAFWLLGEEEMWKIFFGGLLGAGRFSLARSLLNPSSMQAPLEPNAVEDLVVSASREFYDNAEEGNLNRGDMKLAFDCLAVAPQTPRIRQERDFIEATSRLCSFRLESRAGIPVTPIEIRHSSDRLSFISRLLARNDDAFRHPEMVLDLVTKLGYRGDRLAEVRTLAMIGDAAMSARDFDRAATACDRMVEIVERMKKLAGKGKDARPESISIPSSFGAAPSSSTMTVPPSEEAASLVWRSCLQLGRNPGFGDSARRMQVLGQALVLCPPDQIATILPVWTETEHAVVQENRRKKLDELEAKAKGEEKDAVLAAASAAGAGAVKVASFLAAAASSAANSTSHRISPAPSPAPPSPRRVPPRSPPAASSSSSPSRSPFAAVSSGTSHSGHLVSEASAAASHTFRRAAAYLPFAAPSALPASTYTFSAADEGEEDNDDDSTSLSTPPPAAPEPDGSSSFVAGDGRRPRPSSPPSRFASAFDSLSFDPSPKTTTTTTTRPGHSLSASSGPGGGGGGFRAGLSSRFTQGVGWLIGADELLEQERRMQGTPQ
ncbi:hypothetical protein JCM11491_005637 [Sporobolomyces phaffii]